MRGRADDQPPLFHVFDVEDRIRAADHPLRDIKRRADRILAGSPRRVRRRLQPNRPAGRAARTAAQGPPPDGPVLGPQRAAARASGSTPTSCSAGSSTCSRARTPSTPPTFTHNRQRLDDHGLTAAFFDAVVARGADRRAVQRALQRRRHADRELRLGQELPARSRRRRSRTPDGASPRRTQRLQAAATPRSTSAARSGPTRRTAAGPTRSRGCTARRPGKEAKLVAHGPRCWARTGTA